MDQNVHGMRHSFWNLNREIIEDLRELLVFRRRAADRSGRLDRCVRECVDAWLGGCVRAWVDAYVGA